MIRRLVSRFIIAAVLSAGGVVTPAAADPHPPVPDGNGSCGNCHACDRPSTADRCLLSCRRDRVVPGQSAADRGPRGVVLLDMLSDLGEGLDRFGPVPFDHGGHARMADIDNSCATCHHRTPPGAAPPACRTCHETSLRRGDMTKPSLKGAYHRQCLGCHREWAQETSCSTCHVPRIGQPEAAAAQVTKDDIIGLMHPPIPEPETETYRAGLSSPAGGCVIFRHREHVERFGLRCADCHRGDSCMTCHQAGRQHVQRIRTPAEHHQPCQSCHNVTDDDRCGHCHWPEGGTPPPPFDHATTGWPLSRYHRGASCRACHPAVPFERPDRTCDACHRGWTASSFDHRVTGQALDGHHATVACAECHADRRFDRPPTCGACHEEEEGIAFPQRRPGPLPGSIP